MALVQYQPFNALNQLQQEINRLFDLSTSVNDDSGTLYARDWAPAVDIREEPDRYVVYADIPGVNPEEIDITMENNVLTISGERRAEADDKANGFRRVERVRGKFLRRFTLPQSADADKISAKSTHGTLEVVIPKREQALSRRIPIKAK
jgi:HSP20 family protein